MIPAPLSDEIVDAALSEYFDMSPRDFGERQRVAMRKAILTALASLPLPEATGGRETPFMMQEVLDFLNSIEGDGYGGMASFEIVRGYAQTLVVSSTLRTCPNCGKCDPCDEKCPNAIDDGSYTDDPRLGTPLYPPSNSGSAGE